METILIALGTIGLLVVSVLLIKYLQGDFNYKDEVLFYDRQKEDFVYKRTYDSGKVEILRKKFKN